jgi:predicted P-loop ATPase
MLMLSGRAGIGKTTFFMELGLNMWAHSTSMSLDSKDFIQEVIGSWILIFDEMSAFKKGDHETAKAFITKTNDVFRTPYGRTMQTYPRRAIFAGTTNESEFARESSGMRRFWPLECGTEADHIDIPKLIEWRDQLWAEAFARVQRGEKAYASTPEECEALEVLQSEIVVSDAWQPAVVAWVQSRSVSEINGGFTVAECLEGALKMEPAQQQHGAKCRIGLILRDCFNATSRRVGKQRVTKFFLPVETIADNDVLRERFGREEVMKLINASKLPNKRLSESARVWLGLNTKSLPDLNLEANNEHSEDEWEDGFPY